MVEKEEGRKGRRDKGERRGEKGEFAKIWWYFMKLW